VRTRHKLLLIETAARQIGQLLLDVMSDVIPQTDFEEMRMYITGREAQKLNAAMGQDINTDIIFSPQPEIFDGKYVVFVERGSVELRNPQVKAQKYKEMIQIIIGALPILQQAGVQPNLKKFLEVWLQSEGISDTDEFLEPDQEALLIQQQQMMAQGGQGVENGGPGASQGAQMGDATQPGNPRQSTARPPTAAVSTENSGQLPARPY
jgi:hypothetical protein